MEIEYRNKVIGMYKEACEEFLFSVYPAEYAEVAEFRQDLGETRDYKRAVTVRNELRFAFMIIRSLEPSNIEWGEVDLEKPSTWTKWDDELKKAGLSETDVNRVVGAVMIANSLDEDKIKEAREAFLRGQGA